MTHQVIGSTQFQQDPADLLFGIHTVPLPLQKYHLLGYSWHKCSSVYWIVPIIAKTGNQRKACIVPVLISCSSLTAKHEKCTIKNGEILSAYQRYRERSTRYYIIKLAFFPKLQINNSPIAYARLANILLPITISSQ
jgi:hypothetical protein